VILVDSSVWIDHFRDPATQTALRLRALIERELLLVGDVLLCEVLQGIRSDAEARLVEEAWREFELVTLVDPELAIIAAANYGLLRGRGVTVRTTVDLVIGTFCIERGHVLLHNDRDFEPMEHFLGLQTV